MQLQEIFDTQTISIGIKNSNKNSVLKKLAQNLKKQGYIDNIDSFLKDVYQRENEGPTGIGNYIAIPHGKSLAVIKAGVAIGILENEIEWETIDDNGVKVVILLAVNCNTKDSKAHLKLLANLASKLGSDEVVENLIKSTTIENVINSFIYDNT